LICDGHSKRPKPTGSPSRSTNADEVAVAGPHPAGRPIVNLPIDERVLARGADGDGRELALEVERSVGISTGTGRSRSGRGGRGMGVSSDLVFGVVVAEVERAGLVAGDPPEPDEEGRRVTLEVELLGHDRIGRGVERDLGEETVALHEAGPPDLEHAVERLALASDSRAIRIAWRAFLSPAWACWICRRAVPELIVAICVLADLVRGCDSWSLRPTSR